jgi:ABC-type multidrug transport system fused ATPase/permease subunit
MELATVYRVHYGRMLAEGPPRDPKNPRCWSLSQDMTPTAQPPRRGENVHTYYGKNSYLAGVSLYVAPGEVVGLLGRTGR